MKIGRLLFVGLLAGAAVGLVVRLWCGSRPVGDLFSLVSNDPDAAGVLREFAEQTAQQGRILLEGTDADRLVATAGTLAAQFDPRAAVDYKQTLASLDGYTAGLLAPDTRTLLQEGRYKDVADAAAAKLFGFVPPLFSVKCDPFLLATDYALSLQRGLAAGWTMRDGYPVYATNGVHYLLLNVDFTHVAQTRLVAFLDAAQASVEASSAADVKIWCSGPPFHAARATASATREINLLSTVSLVLVAGFGWLLFRSFAFVPELLLALGAGFLAGTSALFLGFPTPHVLTFVFGTSLIGLAVDYVYHARAAGDVRQILRSLALSALTTVACLTPLLFASVSVLRQMALFTIAGLGTVFAYVVLFHVPAPPLVLPPGRRPFRFSRWGRRGVELVGVVLALGLLRGRLTDNPAAFYTPDAYLAASERLLMNLNPTGATRFVHIHAPTLQAALEKEEAAGLKGASSIVPSLKRQRENAELVRRLYAAEGNAYTALTGLPMPAADGLQTAFLDVERLEDEGLRRLTRVFRLKGHPTCLLAMCPPEFASDDPDVRILDPQGELLRLFATYSRETVTILGFSFVALVGLLAVVFRKDFVRYVKPMVLSAGATAGLMGWLQIPATFFTLLCFFVLVGLGLDYVIFHQGSRSPVTARAVFFSFLTSLAGLGMLAFTAFPVTHAMGVTFAAGLSFAYLFAVASVVREDEADAQDGTADAPWHRQREQSAGRLRMLFMWYVYTAFGKNVLKVICVPVVAFIYPFAKPARAALREYYAVLAAYRKCALRPTTYRLFRHLLGFAWSMVDKTDACTRQKDLPRLRVRDDADGRAFRALVSAGKGAFLVSTHVGTVEVLPALAATTDGTVPHVHAFQQMGHDAVFTRVFMEHFNARATTLHAVEDIGVETAVEMQAAIGRGDCVLMAGDRVSAGSARQFEHVFLGRPCTWPAGVFAFARLMDAPIFFVVCARTGWNAYEVSFRAFRPTAPGRPPAREILDQYVDFLEAATCAHPDQWYQFYRFFAWKA